MNDDVSRLARLEEQMKQAHAYHSEYKENNSRIEVKLDNLVLAMATLQGVIKGIRLTLSFTWAMLAATFSMLIWLYDHIIRDIKT